MIMHPYYTNTVLIMDINIAGITLYSILKDLLVLSTVYII